VPGDSFPDVSTGVLAQFQHLVAYSGERVANPVAPRTREKQDDIVQRSLALRRPVTFKDLAGRWAADRRYGVSIEAIASRFRATYCNGPEPAPQPETTPPAGVPVAEAVTKRETPRVKALVTGGTERQAPTRPARGEVPPQPAAAAKPAPPTEVTAKAERPEKAPAQGQSRLALAKPAPAGGACAVLTASYGGARNVLIRAESSGETQYTALQVLDGQEQRLAKSFIRTHAAGGEAIGEFPSREAALAKAFELCPSARVAQ
jgi:hypothetical protein